MAWPAFHRRQEQGTKYLPGDGPDAEGQDHRRQGIRSCMEIHSRYILRVCPSRALSLRGTGSPSTAGGTGSPSAIFSPVPAPGTRLPLSSRSSMVDPHAVPISCSVSWPLPASTNHVPRPSHGQGLPDGGPPVRLPDPGGEARGKARRTSLNVPDDGFRVFRAGVVGGEDHQVRQRRARSLPSQGAWSGPGLPPQPNRHSSRHCGHVPGGGEDLLQGVRSMGVVDEHRVGRRHRHHLHPALDPGNPQRRAPAAWSMGSPRARPAGQDRQGVVNSKAAGNGQMVTGQLPWGQSDLERTPGRGTAGSPGPAPGPGPWVSAKVTAWQGAVWANYRPASSSRLKMPV